MLPLLINYVKTKTWIMCLLKSLETYIKLSFGKALKQVKIGIIMKREKVVDGLMNGNVLSQVIASHRQAKKGFMLLGTIN